MSTVLKTTIAGLSPSDAKERIARTLADDFSQASITLDRDQLENIKVMQAFVMPDGKNILRINEECSIGFNEQPEWEHLVVMGYAHSNRLHRQLKSVTMSRHDEFAEIVISR